MKIDKTTLREILDEVIISHRNGKAYLKRRPQKVNNPRTESQKCQRGKFKAASAFVSQNLVELIRPYWNPEAKRQGMSGQNLFCKLNTHAFDAEGHPNMEKLVPVTGDLGGIEKLSLELCAASGLRFVWLNNARDQKTSGQNQLKIFGLNASLQADELDCSATREAERACLEFEAEKYSHLFLFFWNEKLELASLAEWVEI